MTTELEYRDAVEEDAGRLVEMANSYFLDNDLSEASMRDLVQDRTVKVVEDSEEDELVGYVSYRAVEDAVVVQHLSVVPDYREEGVPGELVSFPVEFAKEYDMRTRVAVDEESWCVSFLDGTDFGKEGTARFAGDTLVIYER